MNGHVPCLRLLRKQQRQWPVPNGVQLPEFLCSPSSQFCITALFPPIILLFIVVVSPLTAPGPWLPAVSQTTVAFATFRPCRTLTLLFTVLGKKYSHSLSIIRSSPRHCAGGNGPHVMGDNMRLTNTVPSLAW